MQRNINTHALVKERHIQYSFDHHHEFGGILCSLKIHEQINRAKATRRKICTKWKNINIRGVFKIDRSRKILIYK